MLTLHELLKRAAKKILPHKFLDKHWWDLYKGLPFNQIRTGVGNYWRTYRFLDDLRSLTRMDRAGTCLDVGGGYSSLLFCLSNPKRYVVDLPHVVDYLTRRFDIPEGLIYIGSGGENLDAFESSSVDLLICSNALDHMNHPEAALLEFNRVLNPAGFAILTLDIHEHIVKKDKIHPHSYTRAAFYQTLEKTGFETTWTAETVAPVMMEFIRHGRISDQSVHGSFELVAVVRKKGSQSL